MAKSTCIVCDEKIELKKGKNVIRCIVCDNTVHENHSDECNFCHKVVCFNDLQFKDMQEICKNCQKEYEKNLIKKPSGYPTKTLR